MPFCKVEDMPCGAPLFLWYDDMVCHNRGPRRSPRSLWLTRYSSCPSLWANAVHPVSSTGDAVPLLFFVASGRCGLPQAHVRS